MLELAQADPAGFQLACIRKRGAWEDKLTNQMIEHGKPIGHPDSPKSKEERDGARKFGVAGRLVSWYYP